MARAKDGHAAPPIARRSAGKSTLAAVAVLLMVLTNPVSAQAAWSTKEVALTATVNAGTLAVTQSGFADLAKVYSSGALMTTAPITLANTGTVPAPFTLTLGAQAATGLAAAASVQLWSVASAEACTAGTTAGGVAGKSWTTIGAETGTLAPGAKAYYCVRSSVSQAQRFALVGQAVTATATLTAAQGSWTTIAAVTTAVQSVANTLTPAWSQSSTSGDGNVVLAWTAPADTVAITGYRVYRVGVTLPIATVLKAQTTYTDTGLSVSTAYAYTIEAVDSASPVNVSPRSDVLSRTTSAPNSSAWYTVTNATTGLCVDAEGGTPANGTALISYSCNGGNNQAWRFTPTGSYLKVTPRGATSLYWDSTTDRRTPDRVLLQTTDKTARQRWTVTAITTGGGTFTLRDLNGLCLDTAGGTSSGGNAQLKVATCAPGSLNQSFRLTNAG